MLENSHDLSQAAAPYLEEFNAFCQNSGIAEKVRADHLGLKCSTMEKYELQRRLFESDSRFMYQSIVSKRRISIVGLTAGLETIVGKLNYLELSDQKPDGSQKDQIDHLEIVSKEGSYEELISHLQAKGVIMKEIVRPHHTTYDIIMPSGFIVRLSHELLIDKIKREEMV
jgi:predicted metalloenzyme YecM